MNNEKSIKLIAILIIIIPIIALYFFIKLFIPSFVYANIGLKLLYILLFMMIIIPSLLFIIFLIIFSNNSTNVIQNPLYIAIILLKENSFFRMYSRESTINDFIKKMHKMKYSFSYISPYVKIINSKSDYVKEMIFEYYKAATREYDKTYYLDNLLYQDSHDLVPFFISEIKKYNYNEHYMLCTMIGDFISKFSSKDNTDDLLNILDDEHVDIENKLIIIKICGKLKINRIAPHILNMLNSKVDDLLLEKEIKIMCIKILSKIDEKKEYKYIYNKYLNDDDKDIKNLCKKILDKIENKAR